MLENDRNVRKGIHAMCTLCVRVYARAYVCDVTRLYPIVPVTRVCVEH